MQAGGIRGNAQGQTLVRRTDDHRRQPHPRAGGAGAAEPMAQDRRRGAPEKRAGAGAVRRNVPHRNFDLAMYAWTSAPESVPRSTLHSSEIPNAANGYAGQNAAGFPKSRRWTN